MSALKGGWEHSPDRPVAGYYQTRLVKGGVMVPVHLWQEDGGWRATVDGEPYDGDIYHLWVWSMDKPIAESEYHYLLARGRHAKRWQPDQPAANPRQPVDWLRVKLPKGKK